MALDGVFGLLVLVPVRGAGRVTFDQQVADLADPNGLAIVVQDLRFVARHWLARRSRANRTRLVGDENVADLRRSDTVEDGHAKALLKTFEDRWRQGFTC